MSVRLHLGDCLDFLSGLPGKSMDAVITDPPFEEEAHTLQRRLLGHKNGSRREIVSAPLDFAAMDELTRDLFAYQAVRLCKGWAIVFCQAESVALWRHTFEAVGGSYRRAMVWIKPDGMPQYSGDRPGMGYESIVAIWCGEGKSVWNGGGRHGVFTYNKSNGAGPNLHPTQKPIVLMGKLISLFSNPGDVVLDPFMGSASTGVACLKTGRSFVGYEIDPTYFAIAERRIAEAQLQPLLFGEAA